MSEEVKPVYAQAFFNVSKEFVTYYLIFDYHDSKLYYSKLIRDEVKFEEEMNKVYYNMQNFLKEEKVRVNGHRCEPNVLMVDLGFRGSHDRPYLAFLIGFEVRLKGGLNVYENEYPPEIIEYDYVAYWHFPPNCKIKEVEMKEEYEIVNDRILVIYGNKGKYISGYEMISFFMKD